MPGLFGPGTLKKKPVEQEDSQGGQKVIVFLLQKASLPLLGVSLSSATLNSDILKS